MAYEDELKAIATAETEEERLRLSGELAGELAEAPDADALAGVTKERDDYRAQLEESEKKYNDLREKYVDAFFSTAQGATAPKTEPAKEPEKRTGATLASFLGKE